MENCKKVQEKRDLKIQKRINRVIELRCMGLSIPQIQKKLEEEGWKVSEHTVWKDLHSKITQEFIDELIRKQLADIALCGDDYKTRLMYRADLIEKLMPSKKPDVEMNLNVNQQTIIKQNGNLLEEYSNAILQASEINENIPAICTGESVDSKETSPSNGENGSKPKADTVPVPP